MGLEVNKVRYKKEWPLIRLKEVCNRISDGTHFTPEYVKEGVPFISVKDIYESKVHFDKCKFITEEAHKELIKRCYPEKDDVLITKSGTIGRMALVPEKPEFSLFVSVALIKNKKDVISSKFLKLCLENFLNSINISQDIKGGLLKNFHLEDIRETLIPVVSLNEQASIVSKIEELFSELDKSIETLRLAQQQLKTYRQAVLKWAFEGKLTEEWRKENGTRVRVPAGSPKVHAVKTGLKPKLIAAEPLTEYRVANNDVELPGGWKWMKLSDVAKKKSVKALPKDYPNAKFIGMDCIEAHTLKPKFLYDFSEFKSAGNYFKTNQVLYGRMRPYLNKVYRAEFDGACSGEFIILDCGDDYNPDLLKYILHSKGFVSFANSITTGDRPRISYEEIAEYSIPFCSMKEQLQIISEIESRLSVADKTEESIVKSLLQAEALRQSILKTAFEGKLI